MRYGIFLIGLFINSLGVSLITKANLGTSPISSIPYVLSLEFPWSMGVFTILFNVLLVILQLILLQKKFKPEYWLQIPVAALLVGFLARLLGRWLSFLPGKLYPSVQVEVKTEKQENYWCITIERQYGCGGREIGKELAQKLGWAYYDSDLIQAAAGTTGLPEEFVEEKEEEITGSLLFDLLHSMEGYGGNKAAPQDRIYQAESQAIREVAAKGNCVIVGRCGDFVLREDENCLRVFLHGEPAVRARRVQQREGLTLQQAEEKLQREDRRRREHYRYYTHGIWGLASNYHLTMDTGLGLAFARQGILAALKEKQAQKEST